jgi:hypothetical protein
VNRIVFRKRRQGRVQQIVNILMGSVVEGDNR